MVVMSLAMDAVYEGDALMTFAEGAAALILTPPILPGHNNHISDKLLVLLPVKALHCSRY